MVVLPEDRSTYLTGKAIAEVFVSAGSNLVINGQSIFTYAVKPV